MKGVINSLLLMMVVVACIILTTTTTNVSAQCDPTVCANPGAFQELASSTSTSRTSRRVPPPPLMKVMPIRDNDDSPFTVFTHLLDVPLVPLLTTTAINITFYSMLNAIFLSDDPQVGTQQLTMTAHLEYLPTSSPQPQWAVQAIMELQPLNFVLTSQLTPLAADNSYVNITMANIPYSTNPPVMPNLITFIQPGDGKSQILLISQYLPTALENITLSAGLLVQSTQEGVPIVQTPCTALPPSLSNSFTDIQVESVNGPLPIDFIVNPPPPVGDLYCNLAATVHDDTSGSDRNKKVDGDASSGGDDGDGGEITITWSSSS